ncbi:hypothetical protein SCYAM73S_04163 [Streptomyces cyaneofuscatus]
MHRAGERRRQVEAEAVDAHLGDPVAQRIGDEPQHLGLDDVQGVAAAGVVGVAAGVVLEAVVAAVVDAAQGEHRAELTGLGGVVVDDVEDDLDPRSVQGVHHPLELADLAARRAGGGVVGVRGEVADGVVAPVVVQPAPQQMVLVGELVDRQQLDGRHPEPRQVVDRGRVREPGVGAAQLGRDVRVELGEAAYVEFVDDRVRPRGLGRRSSTQSSSSWTTTPLGTCGAESRSSRTVSATCCWGQSRTCPYTSGGRVKVPSTARAYGSRSSLAAFQRAPVHGSQRPCTR